MQEFNLILAKIKPLIEKLEISKDYKEYSDAEFLFFDLQIESNDCEYSYDLVKIKIEREKTKKFIELRPDQKSDAATNKVIDEIMKSDIDTLDTIEAECKMMKNTVKVYARLLSHLAGFFIREQGEIKRQTVVESIQDKIPIHDDLPF